VARGVDIFCDASQTHTPPPGVSQGFLRSRTQCSVKTYRNEFALSELHNASLQHNAPSVALTPSLHHPKASDAPVTQRPRPCSVPSRSERTHTTYKPTHPPAKTSSRRRSPALSGASAAKCAWLRMRLHSLSTDTALLFSFSFSMSWFTAHGCSSNASRSAAHHPAPPDVSAAHAVCLLRSWCATESSCSRTLG